MADENVNQRYKRIQMLKGERLQCEGQLSYARTIFEELLSSPTILESELHYRLGNICIEQGDNRAAERHLRELIRLSPEFVEGRMLLGMACAELGMHEQAVEYLRGVVAEYHELATVHHRIGLSLAELRRFQEALQAYQDALRIEPGHSGVLCSIGLMLSTMGRMAEAQLYLEQSLERDSGNLGAMNNLGRAFKMRGKAAEGLAWFEKVLEREPDNGPAASNYLYTLNYVPDIPRETIAAHYRELAPRCFSARTHWVASGREPRDPSAPLKIGYLSADFFGHSVAFFLEPVMLNHDRSRFQIFCYYNRATGDRTTERLKALATGWREIWGVPDQQVAAMIDEDMIDVLVDLSGHTAGHRLGVFSYRPAQLQVSWIGHPNTTGLDQVDYYISDARCDPPGMTEHLFTERLWRLPRIFCCYLPPEESPPVSSLPAISSGHITLGCFNNFAKVNEHLISWWAAILREIPGAKLCLKNQAVDDHDTRSETLEHFSRHGIAAERIIMYGITKSREEHLALYSQIDLVLDTFPYHGTTTTCEALWMGVPVVTIAGDTHVTRVGVSLLTAVGLADLIAATPEEYVATAIRLAGDVSRLKSLRSKLRFMITSSPLMDASGVTREVEAAFEAMLAAAEIEKSPLHTSTQTGCSDSSLFIPDAESADDWFMRGQPEKAEQLYREMLAGEPLDAEIHNRLATALDRQGHYLEAIGHYQKALALRPAFTVARYNLANTLQRWGATDEALAKLLLVTAAEPDFADAWKSRALCSFDLGRLEEAALCFGEVLRLRPDDDESRLDLGNTLVELGRFRDALECFDIVLASNPADTTALTCKGIAMQELEDLDGAETCFHRVLDVDPNHHEAFNNLGTVHRSRGDTLKAIEFFDRALELVPGDDQVLFNRTLARLALGDYCGSWRDYESRLTKKSPVKLLHTELPRWNGEPLQGRRLLVQCEQGYGDTLQFIRYLPLLSGFGGPVIFECQDKIIKPVVATVAGVEGVFARGEELPEANFQVPLLSLPMIFNTGLDNIPSTRGYLHADPLKVLEWKNELAGDDATSVGLVWGGRKNSLNANRSLSLAHLLPLLELPDVRFISLQLGPDASQATALSDKILDLSGRIRDFGDTAAIIAGIDLVISIDTATAHLAGALGAPVWLLLKRSPDWRWHLEREDSPWYASARLFRQQIPGDWTAVVSSVYEALKIFHGHENNIKDWNVSPDM